MTDLLNAAVDRLEALPDDEQDRQAAAILERLERYESLRGAIAEGVRAVEAGDTVPFDPEAIVRRGHERRDAAAKG